MRPARFSCVPSHKRRQGNTSRRPWRSFLERRRGAKSGVGWSDDAPPYEKGGIFITDPEGGASRFFRRAPESGLKRGPKKGPHAGGQLGQSFFGTFRINQPVSPASSVSRQSG